MISRCLLVRASIHLILIIASATGASSGHASGNSSSSVQEIENKGLSASSAAYGDEERQQEKEAQLAQMADLMNQQHMSGNGGQQEQEQPRPSDEGAGDALQGEESAPMLFALKADHGDLRPTAAGNSSDVPKSPTPTRPDSSALTANETLIEDEHTRLVGAEGLPSKAGQASQAFQERELTPEMLHDPSEQESDKLLPSLRRHQALPVGPRAGSTTGSPPQLTSPQTLVSTEASLVSSSTSRPTTRRTSAPAVLETRAPSVQRAYQPARRPSESFASSLQPKHVSPPFVPATSLDKQAQFLESANPQWSPMASPVRLTEKQLVMPLATQAGMILAPTRPAQTKLVETSHRALVGSLRGKSFSHLLPRLAAKLFTGELEGGQDSLKQQQSYQQATHFSPATSTPQPGATRASRLLISPRSRLVKNLFGRKPGLTSSTPSPPVSLEPTVGAAPLAGSSAHQFVLMNGRLYSIVSASQPSQLEQGPAITSAQASTASTPVFDHQTSDTSEFPVFEAMSMQANAMLSDLSDGRPASMLSQSSMEAPRAPSSGTNNQLRCDRPRHVIQADRMVVNHILQSQQNFVIARVPIKKLSRPGAESSPSASSYQAQSGAHYGLDVAAGLSQPYLSNLVLSPAASGSFGSTQPSYQTSTPIHFSASIERPSIWQSFVNLMTGMRRRPAASAASGNSMLVDGPVIVAAGRRQRRRLDSVARRLLVSASPALASYLAEPLLVSATSAQSSQQPAIDPMRRLLMLKTATDDEVCTPVGELESKIKYSCVPNHCVVMALANSSAARYSSGQPASYQQSASSVREHKANQHRPQVESGRGGLANHTGAPLLAAHYGPPPPVVTYTHINAYQTPALTRLVQPQHQHIESSSQQLLDSLAQQDYSQSQMLGDQSPPAPESALGASSSSELSSASPLIYVQLPMRPPLIHFGSHEQPNTIYQTILTSTGRPSTGAPNSYGSVTLGTIRAPARTTSSPRWTASGSSSSPSTSPRARAKPVRQQPGSAAQHVSQRPETGDSSANDFVSAVDEQLERPIRVRARKRRKLRPAGFQPSQDMDSVSQLNYNLPAGSDQAEPESSPGHTHPASSLANKRRRENIGLPIQDNSQPSAYRRPLAPKGGRRVKQLNEPAPDEEVTEEDLDEEAPNDYDEPPAGADEHRVPVNMSLPLAVSRKTRRDQFARLADRHRTASTASPAQALRYGLRQSTPLPAPEKPQAPDYEQYSNHLDQQLTSSNADDLNEPLGRPTDDTTTDCDCAKTSPLPGNATGQPSAQLGQQEGQPRARQSQQQANIMLPTPRSSYKRNPTTLRPIKTGGNSSEFSAGANIAQDRRREASSPDSRLQPIRFSTTKRPYNLRNTTYKNLPLTLGGSGSLVGNYNTAAVSLAVAPDSGPSPSPSPELPSDMSSTRATIRPAGELEPASSWQANETRAANASSNNHSTFDDSLSSTPEPGPLAGTFESIASLHPTEPVNTSERPPTDNGVLERFHELNGESQDRISAILGAQRQPSNGANETGAAQQEPKARPTPWSVNEILAQTRAESVSATNEKPIRNRAPLDAQLDRLPKHQDLSDDQDDEPNDENDVTPHQYQIQVRWSNSSSSEPSASADLRKPYTSETAKSEILLQPKGGLAGERGFELDRLREQVKDRLFEHREEEHWHERQRQRLAHKRRKLPNGSWQLEPASGAPSAKLMSQLDYGPGHDQRETPVKDQLPDWPSEAERERHFAIPTRNFRQSAKFLDWVQRDVNLDEDPGEPEAKASQPATGP